MTAIERLNSYVHILKAMPDCKEICGHQGRRQNLLMAYHKILELGRDEFDDFDEYIREEIGDPMM